MPDDYNWRDDALCVQVSPDLFFNDDDSVDNTAEAKKICNMCDVKDQCLMWALEVGEQQWGVLGGLSPRQRRKVRKKYEDVYGWEPLAGRGSDQAGTGIDWVLKDRIRKGGVV